MASITAHLMIAHDVANSIPLYDLSAFYLGVIAPDSVSSAEKGFTHYTERIAGRPYYRWDRFLDEHWRSCNEGKRSYLLGYFCHLLADEEWDRYVRFPLKDNPTYSSLPTDIRRSRYYTDMSRMDILIRPEESIRRKIAEYLMKAEYPCLPRGLGKEQVYFCVDYACRDLFKLEDQTRTEFLDIQVVKDMRSSAVDRVIHICRLFASGM